jgi:hypothetical protein
VKEALVRLGGMLPMNIFLRQEIDRMQKILTLVRRTLSDLKGQSHQCFFSSSRNRLLVSAVIF